MNKVGCSIVSLAFVTLGIKLIMSIDEKTGKIREDDNFAFGLIFILLFIFLIFVIVIILKENFKGEKLSVGLDNPEKNVIHKDTTIREYTFKIFVKSFICPHCLKSIIVDKITEVTCPFCDTTSDSLLGFFILCPSCHSKIKYFNCPYCDESIDLDAPYNHKELEEKRNG